MVFWIGSGAHCSNLQVGPILTCISPDWSFVDFRPPPGLLMIAQQACLTLLLCRPFIALRHTPPSLCLCACFNSNARDSSSHWSVSMWASGAIFYEAYFSSFHCAFWEGDVDSDWTSNGRTIGTHALAICTVSHLAGDAVVWSVVVAIRVVRILA